MSQKLYEIIEKYFNSMCQKDSKYKKGCDWFRGVLDNLDSLYSCFMIKIKIYGTNGIDVKISRIKLQKDPKFSKNILS